MTVKNACFAFGIASSLGLATHAAHAEQNIIVAVHACDFPTAPR